MTTTSKRKRKPQVTATTPPLPMNTKPSSIDLAWRDVVRCIVYERLHDAHVRAYVNDVARAWDRMHPGVSLPENPHAALAAIYGDETERAWIGRRTNRRNYLLGRIYVRTMHEIAARASAAATIGGPE